MSETTSRPSLTFEEWRRRARPLLTAGIEPEDACRSIAEGGEPESAPAPAPAPAGPTPRLKLPAALMRLLDSLSCFRSAGRYELMYRLAWRTLFDNPRLLEDPADRDVRNATLMDSSVRRDVHKMHAFVRFRAIADEGCEPAYVAWFEPEHEILRRGSTFFVKRFPNMRWTIATPDGAAVWNKTALTFAASPGRDALPASDGHEDLWRTYYRSICNIARINTSAMQREMPRKYWRNLPEAADIGILIRDGRANAAAGFEKSRERVNAMTKAVGRALADIPPRTDGPQECRRCDLWQRATQAVLGVGPKDASIMLVGEQPGDEEDLQGRPFIGPAGRLLDEAINAAGLDRSRLYVTNAVKHFKWEPRGKRRLHQKPNVREIDACHVWLETEITDVAAPVIVALGATALRSLTGSTLSIAAARHQSLSQASGASIVVTYHPSAILRAEGEHAADLRAKLIADLARARDLAAATLTR